MDMTGVIADKMIMTNNIPAYRLLYVHDELQYETYPEYADKVGAILVESMGLAGEEFNLNVPITGEVSEKMPNHQLMLYNTNVHRLHLPRHLEYRQHLVRNITRHTGNTTGHYGKLLMRHGQSLKGTSRSLWNEGDELLKEVTSIDSWSEADKKMLMMGIYYSAKALKNKRQKEKAKVLMNKIAQWFEGDEEFKALYDEIVN